MAKPEPKKPAPTPLEAAAQKAEALAFSSTLAARLVQAVPEADRIPLLGDLLAALHHFVPQAKGKGSADDDEKDTDPSAIVEAARRLESRTPPSVGATSEDEP